MNGRTLASLVVSFSLVNDRYESSLIIHQLKYIHLAMEVQKTSTKSFVPKIHFEIPFFSSCQWNRNFNVLRRYCEINCSQKRSSHIKKVDNEKCGMMKIVRSFGHLRSRLMCHHCHWFNCPLVMKCTSRILFPGYSLEGPNVRHLCLSTLSIDAMRLA